MRVVYLVVVCALFVGGCATRSLGPAATAQGQSSPAQSNAQPSLVGKTHEDILLAHGVPVALITEKLGIWLHPQYADRISDVSREAFKLTPEMLYNASAYFYVLRDASNRMGMLTFQGDVVVFATVHMVEEMMPILVNWAREEWGVN